MRRERGEVASVFVTDMRGSNSRREGKEGEEVTEFTYLIHREGQGLLRQCRISLLA